MIIFKFLDEDLISNPIKLNKVIESDATFFHSNLNIEEFFKDQNQENDLNNNEENKKENDIDMNNVNEFADNKYIEPNNVVASDNNFITFIPFSVGSGNNKKLVIKKNEIIQIEETKENNKMNEDVEDAEDHKEGNSLNENKDCKSDDNEILHADETSRSSNSNSNLYNYHLSKLQSKSCFKPKEIGDNNKIGKSVKHERNTSHGINIHNSLRKPIPQPKKNETTKVLTSLQVELMQNSQNDRNKTSKKTSQVNNYNELFYFKSNDNISNDKLCISSDDSFQVSVPEVSFSKKHIVNLDNPKPNKRQSNYEAKSLGIYNDIIKAKKGRTSKLLTIKKQKELNEINKSNLNNNEIITSNNKRKNKRLSEINPITIISPFNLNKLNARDVKSSKLVKNYLTPATSGEKQRENKTKLNTVNIKSKDKDKVNSINNLKRISHKKLTPEENETNPEELDTFAIKNFERDYLNLLSSKRNSSKLFNNYDIDNNIINDFNFNSHLNSINSISERSNDNSISFTYIKNEVNENKLDLLDNLSSNMDAYNLDVDIKLIDKKNNMEKLRYITNDSESQYNKVDNADNCESNMELNVNESININQEKENKSKIKINKRIANSIVGKIAFDTKYSAVDSESSEINALSSRRLYTNKYESPDEKKLSLNYDNNKDNKVNLLLFLNYIIFNL